MCCNQAEAWEPFARLAAQHESNPCLQQINQFFKKVIETQKGLDLAFSCMGDHRERKGDIIDFLIHEFKSSSRRGNSGRPCPPHLAGGHAWLPAPRASVCLWITLMFYSTGNMARRASSGSVVENLAANEETGVRSMGWEEPLRRK